MFKFLINLFSVMILGFIAFALFRTLFEKGNFKIERTNFSDDDAQGIAAVIFSVRQKAMEELRELTNGESTYLTQLASTLEKWGYEYEESEEFGQAIQTFPC